MNFNFSPNAEVSKLNSENFIIFSDISFNNSCESPLLKTFSGLMPSQLVKVPRYVLLELRYKHNPQVIRSNLTHETILYYHKLAKAVRKFLTPMTVLILSDLFLFQKGIVILSQSYRL